MTSKVVRLRQALLRGWVPVTSRLLVRLSRLCLALLVGCVAISSRLLVRLLLYLCLSHSLNRDIEM